MTKQVERRTVISTIGNKHGNMVVLEKKVESGKRKYSIFTGAEQRHFAISYLLDLCVRVSLAQTLIFRAFHFTTLCLSVIALLPE